MTARSALVPTILALSIAPAAAAQSSALFDAPRYLIESKGGTVRELGDFDGDLDVDLIHVLGTGPTNWTGFRLLTNDGNAVFTPGAEHAFPVTGGSEFCARDEPHAGDFDGDGHLDVAFDHFLFPSGAVGGLEVYFGDGAGGFSTPLNTGVATATAFAVGQADLDPAHEIALWGLDANFDGFLWWLDWDGSAFQPSAGLPLEHGGDPALGLRDAVLVDLDGDGIDDLAGRPWDFEHLRTFKTVGGAFAYGVQIAVPDVFDNLKTVIVAGDVDADGDGDVLLILPIQGYVNDPLVQVHEYRSGSLVPHAMQEMTMPPETPVDKFWQLRDWNGDGANDLLEYSYTLAQFAGNGAGGFQFAGSIRLYATQSEAGVADLDGDGHLDLAASDVVYLGDGTTKTLPAGKEDIDWLSLDTCAFIEDREGDGDLDVIAVAGTSAGVYKANDATGAFKTKTASASGIPLGHFTKDARAFADFSFDGRRDQLVALFQQTSPTVSQFVEMVWLIDDGAGGYTLGGGVTPPGVQIPLPSAPLKHFPAGDIDGDGDQDLLVESGHWENHGTGFGAAKVASFTGDAHDAVDFDGDGDLDIVVANWEGTASNYSTRLLIQSGGTFASQFLNGWSGKPLAFFRDLDLDGDADIVAGLAAGDSTAVHENVGGAVVDRGMLPLMLARKAALAVHDHDSDGLADLFGIGTGYVVTTGSSVVGPAWFRRKGPGLVYDVPLMYRSSSGVRALVDADGDSDIDAVGPYTLDGLEHVEPQSGKVHQYGTGAPGAGGVVPILGASGPMWSGGAAPVERVRRGLGGAPVILIFGFQQASIAGFPLSGLTLYTNPFNIFGTFLLSGPPGVPGVGAFDFPLPTAPALGGLRLYKQAFVIDLAAPSGIASHTNGLELVWGS